MPDTVEKALEILERYEGKAQLIAGGTDLVIELQEGKHAVDCLVDVTRIPGLGTIKEWDGWIVLGANVTFRQIKESPLLVDRARALAEAAGTVGALQIQTVATLAGNVVSALPAADGSVALVALDAEVAIADRDGRTWRPVQDLFLGPGLSAIDPRHQMITGFRLPLAPGRHGSAWERIGRRRTLVLPILNCAATVTLGNGDEITQAHVALGPVAPVPFRALQTEAFLAGQPATDATFQRAGEIAAGESQPRTSLLRASREYRLQVIPVLVRNALARATAQARVRNI
ncbi:MAG: FAD binding domain-containing protein [Anaerolineae bacterium]|nr:FAD binding domain-containing protein [Anaerolineae bacterium]